MTRILPGYKATLARAISRMLILAAAVALGAALLACDAPKTGSPGESSGSETSPQARHDAAVLKTLADPSAPDDARLESIHSARDRQLHAALPQLRALLHSDNPELVVAAAAAVEGLGAEDADLALIEAAGALGRAHHFEHLRQLLYLIGAVGGPRAHTYLSTVAQAHELAPIRNTAAQILEDAPSNR